MSDDDEDEDSALRRRIQELIYEHDNPETGAACQGFCECFGVQTLRELLQEG